MSIGGLLIIALIVLVLFGSKKLPEIGKGLGRAIKEFKSSSDGPGDAANKAPDKEDKRP